jgi:hypothetical protein
MTPHTAHSTQQSEGRITHQQVTVLTMEHLFSPCTRLYDLYENRGDLEDLEEDFDNVKELNLDVSPQELLSAERGFTYAHLYAMLENEDTLVWLTPHATIVRSDGRAETYVNILTEDCYFGFNVDDNEIIVVARSREHLFEICDVILRLVAVSTVHSVFLSNLNPRGYETIDAPALEYLMEQCQSLKSLSMYGLEMDENHCRVLGSYSRPDLEIALFRSTLTSAGTSALAEVLGRNQGPTRLHDCDIDYSILADGLRGNSRLKRLRVDYSSNLDDDNRRVLAIANAVRENKGLVELDFQFALSVSDETWGAICDSLKTHPTLEVLYMPATLNTAMTGPAIITSRIQALLDLMKLNLSIHTMHLHDQDSNHELFRESVIPYLETNLFRPRLLAIQKTRPIAYRAKVLGHALLAVRNDPNRLWMLLSGNAEVAFPSTTTTTTPAANLPTPASASALGATGGATNPVATGGPAADIAAPASGQKRKMCP